MPESSAQPKHKDLSKKNTTKKSRDLIRVYYNCPMFFDQA